MPFGYGIWRNNIITFDTGKGDRDTGTRFTTKTFLARVVRRGGARDAEDSGRFLVRAIKSKSFMSGANRLRCRFSRSPTTTTTATITRINNILFVFFTTRTANGVNMGLSIYIYI